MECPSKDSPLEKDAVDVYTKIELLSKGNIEKSFSIVDGSEEPAALIRKVGFELDSRDNRKVELYYDNVLLTKNQLKKIS